MERSVRITVGGRAFTMRPVSVLGMMEAHRIMVSPETERGAVEEAMEDLRIAAAGKDQDQAGAALGRLYLSMLDGMGVERFASLMALVLDPSDPELIRAAIERDRETAMVDLLGAVGQLHDLPRLLRRFAPQAGEPGGAIQDEDSEGVGLETVLVWTSHYLPGYRFEEILAWPYERFLSVQEQMSLLIGLHASGDGITRAPGKLDPTRASVEQLQALGIPGGVFKKRPKPSVN